MVDDPRALLLRELADPVRLRVVDRLTHGGPATVSELSQGLEVAMPRLSNHLKRLRDAGLVAIEQRGRHTLYRLANDDLEQLLPLLDHLTGSIAVLPANHAESRTCYDHLAGPLGVGLYRALLDRDVLEVDAAGGVEVTSRGAGVLRRLGVSPDRPDGRRRFAFECFDATEHRPHLAGVLGDRLAEALVAHGWVRHADGRRVVVTPPGRRALRRALGLALDDPK